ncbi:MAG: Transposase 31 protein [Acidobacteriota bacterium]|nr:Transposase 31 protein [Acidobacteriota bacterium]
MGTVFQELLDRGKEIGIEIGVKEGEERGEERGEEKKAIRVALNCLMKGMDSLTVAEITELSVERIESLKAAIRLGNSSHL